MSMFKGTDDFHVETESVYRVHVWKAGDVEWSALPETFPQTEEGYANAERFSDQCRLDTFAGGKTRIVLEQLVSCVMQVRHAYEPADRGPVRPSTVYAAIEQERHGLDCGQAVAGESQSEQIQRAHATYGSY